MELTKTIQFLRKLSVNNNREWFNDNKKLYIEAKDEFEFFIDFMISEIIKVDNTINYIQAKDCIYRIYKDVRFSKDKTPYKINFGAYISNGGRKSEYAGYYIQIEPEASFIGGGLYLPNSKILKSVRDRIISNADEYISIISSTRFKEYFKRVYGEKLKTAPRGYDKNLPNIELIRNKSYAVIHNVNDEFWDEDELVKNILQVFKSQQKFNLFLNSALY